MPWQQLVAEIATEIDKQTGKPAYREIVVTVPRQSGKTTLVLAMELHRALWWPSSQKIAYTAQTGWDARRKLIDDQAPMLMSSPLKASVAKVIRGAGNEAIIFKNSSRIDVLASTESAGHGRTIDLAVLDEAFSDTDDRREQALLPAMATRADAQLLVVSTMGTEASTYLNRKIDTGRAAITDDLGTGIAYFEWSADPNADIDSPDTWRSCMPALGHTITEAVIQHARQTMSEGDFRRSMLNQKTISDERVLSVQMWEQVVSDEVKPDGKLRFAIDVNPDRSAAAVAVSDDTGRCELIDYRPGVTWLVDRVTEICAKWDAPVVLDSYSPAGSLADELQSRGVQVIKYGTREVAHACGLFYDRVADGNVQIRRHEALDIAAAGARRRTAGDAWLWSRKDGGCDISPLVALTLAVDHRGQPQVELWVDFD
jgi:hypothetical protein